jgi:glycosyltransferase involved in cell wall biosynthesis
MRILLLDQYGELGGAQRCLVDIAEGFRMRGWELHAAAPEGDLLNRLQPLCASMRPIACGPFHSMRKDARDALRMAGQLKQQAATISGVVQARGIDVLYVNGPRLMPAIVLARQGIPVVFHAHSVVAQRPAAAMLRTSLRISKAAVIAASHFVARSLSGIAPAVIHNGVNDCARPRKDRQVTVAVLGRIAPEKGQLEFVRAVRMLSGSLECRFVIAGAPLFSGDSYARLVHEEARSTAVQFTGWVDDVPEFLAGVDLLVVPSDGLDATPRVIPEAFSAGTVVAAFAAGGIPELIRNGVDGFLIQERTAEALADGILDAMHKPERFREIRDAARRRWRQSFSVPTFQSAVTDVVQAAAQRRHQRNPLASTGAIVEA